MKAPAPAFARRSRQPYPYDFHYLPRCMRERRSEARAKAAPLLQAVVEPRGCAPFCLPPVERVLRPHGSGDGARTRAAGVGQVRSSQATRPQRRMLAWARGAAMRADGAAQGQPGCAANATAAALQRSRRRYYLPSEATCRVGAAASDRAHSRPSQGRCSGCHAQAVWLQVCSAGEHTARTRADAGRAGRGS